MAISKIIIHTKTAAVELNSNFGIRSSCNVVEGEDYNKGVSIQFNEDSNGIRIDNHDGLDIYKDALAKVKRTPYISSINDIEASFDGSFFILGSECDSIWSIGNDIYIEDICPTCTSCSQYMLLLKHIEYYKMLINYIKDISLYDSDIAASRLNWLQEARVGLDHSCIEELNESLSDVTNLPTMHGIDKLMKEYIATVHMWNYAVNMSGSHTQLTSAPGEPSGFVVQSLRALPSCAGNLSVKVLIEVTGPTTCNDDKLSMYVPEPLVQFLPVGSIDGEPNKCVVEHHVSEHTTKRITYEQSNIVGAGSLCITARFLPFTAMKMYKQDPDKADSWYEVSVDDLMDDIVKTSSSSSKDEDGITTNTTTYFLQIKANNYSVAEPTVEEYNNSRRYPSLTKTHEQLRFTVNIAWSIQSDCAALSSDVYNVAETYYFDCRPLRKCITDLWKNIQSYELKEEQKDA